MTYDEYKDKRQEEFNKLPIFFAFSNDQFEEEMRKRGLTAKDTDKIYRLGDTGGFYLKADAQLIHDYYEKPDELQELMKDPVFAAGAFYYEMANHEYHINWQGDYDVLSCFGKITYSDDIDAREKYFDELGFEPQTRRAYKTALHGFLHDADINGWY